ncbi:HAMP domain-containing sensor histidine kinase [Clostridium vincentii]|uniref:histidine kinase n=1 Tax=Clostridium vincentii TaxID=52704 RepID=A0A2T0BFW6_9CLOT|nr:HAMP domain-containing sensor histidine kinase [Clostridium vincentii]PRR82758.1 Alkaline phosphatase synthesis sensor protein PhoR [Clostridium vincentii]
MNIKKIVISIIGVFLCLGIALGLTLNHISTDELHITDVNDVLMTAETNWYLDLEEAFDSGKDYGFDFVIVDNNDNVMMTSSEGLNEKLQEAIKKQDTIVDIDIDRKTVGKLIIYNNTQNQIQEVKNKILLCLLVSFIILIGITASYMIYLNQRIIKPFHKLNRFAGNVAAGNLDIPLDMDRGNVLGAFTQSFDIMREELMKARESERKANESKKELVVSLSHDIKTPLASIKVIAELMAVQATEVRQQEKLNTIWKKADQIELLTTNLFNSTLEELSELKVVPTEEESNVLRDMIDGADHNHKVKAFIIPDCIILCDKIRMQQVLDNIISNSYKYAETQIEITLELKDGFLQIHIHDDGDGVSEEEILFVMRKYYRGKNGEGKTGSGIGLYVSKYFMEKMEGELVPENTVKGFLITIFLKLA